MFEGAECPNIPPNTWRTEIYDGVLWYAIIAYITGIWPLVFLPISKSGPSIGEYNGLAVDNVRLKVPIVPWFKTPYYLRLLSPPPPCRAEKPSSSTISSSVSSTAARCATPAIATTDKSIILQSECRDSSPKSSDRILRLSTISVYR